MGVGCVFFFAELCWKIFSISCCVCKLFSLGLGLFTGTRDTPGSVSMIHADYNMTIYK